MSLDKLRKSVDKRTQKGTVVTDIKPITALCSTGSLALDVQLAIGGIPENRIIEFLGQPSGGKTGFSILTGAEAQKMGKVVAFFDLENTFDPKWFTNLGEV